MTKAGRGPALRLRNEGFPALWPQLCAVLACATQAHESHRMLPTLAAVIYPKGCAIDALLEDTIAALKAEGLLVAGVVQQADPADPDCCDMLALRDVMSGELTSITENRGKHATACRLDPRGLVEVAARLEAALDQAPDLLVLNRFGKAETEGRGLRSVLTEALVRGIPVLTAVRAVHKRSVGPT